MKSTAAVAIGFHTDTHIRHDAYNFDLHRLTCDKGYAGVGIIQDNPVINPIWGVDAEHIIARGATARPGDLAGSDRWSTPYPRQAPLCASRFLNHSCHPHHAQGGSTGSRCHSPNTQLLLDSCWQIALDHARVEKCEVNEANAAVFSLPRSRGVVNTSHFQSLVYDTGPGNTGYVLSAESAARILFSVLTFKNTKLLGICAGNPRRRVTGCRTQCSSYRRHANDRHFRSG
ncbi:hypothetical protein BPODLACK_01709 [Gordonia sp. YY1]|nr:hypothetical protein BPODLACK_01709 [Gordonia sp. YY1]